MRIEVDGGALHVLTAGRGATILLLHGWTLDHRIFAPQVRQLERDFRVVTFDRRGFGRSQAPPDLGRELDDLDRILEALGAATVHLLGMSQGARIALRFAVTRPERIRSLILQAPVIDGVPLDEPDSERIPMDEFAMLARDGRMDEVRRRWLAHPMMAPGAGSADLRRRLEEIVGSYRGADLLGYSPARDAFPRDVLDDLSGFTRPCLVLTGAYDTQARREHARRLLEAVPHGREVVLRESGHLCNLTEADAYNAEVAAFCASADRQEPASSEKSISEKSIKASRVRRPTRS